MSRHHQFRSERDFGNADVWNDHSFARAPRAARERPDRPGDGETGSAAAGPYVSGDPAVSDASEYNIQINFQGTWSLDLRQAFISAAEAISDFILGDIPTAGTRRAPIDDIVITASMIKIDGAGGVLGQAGADTFRFDSYLPSRGTMEFDVADANGYQASGLFDDIVLHELLHTVGFGTIWQTLGLISDSSFNGALANAVYEGADMIPLETDGGSGTAYFHWDDATFGNELMTGYIEGDNSLSYMTVASLGDLGYSVVSGASYVPPAFV